MHSKDFLAQELEKAGLSEMAAKARTGYYHDFLSPLDLPEMQLMQDLQQAANKVVEQMGDKEQFHKIRSLMGRHMEGEFDATKEESDAWAASPEGQEAFSRLLRGD